MTLWPTSERFNAKGVPAVSYPLNKTCAHPECSEPADDAHHIFRRSGALGQQTSWFVVLMNEKDEFEHEQPLPHVVGLCRKHHDQITDNQAWIKFEGGIFLWYDRVGGEEAVCANHFRLVGPLNPQPGSQAGKPKRKRHTGEARRQRTTISIKVPCDTEDGGAVWDETMEQVKEKLILAGLYGETDRIPVYEALIAALRDWLNTPDVSIVAENKTPLMPISLREFS